MSCPRRSQKPCKSRSMSRSSLKSPASICPRWPARAADSLGDRAGEVPASRGHLVRQAVQDGLLREFDNLIGEDGTVDLVCDPGMEIPLELDSKTLTLTELLEALQYKRSLPETVAHRGSSLRLPPSAARARPEGIRSHFCREDAYWRGNAVRTAKIGTIPCGC